MSHRMGVLEKVLRCLPHTSCRRVNNARQSVRGQALLVRFLIGRVGKHNPAFHTDELAGLDSLCRPNVINHAAVCAGCRLSVIENEPDENRSCPIVSAAEVFPNLAPFLQIRYISNMGPMRTGWR